MLQIATASSSPRAERLRLGGPPESELDSRFLGLVHVARMVEGDDAEARAHGERVAGLCDDIAGTLGWGRAERGRLADAALLHDVGKIAVPDELLTRRGPLAPEELAKVRDHAPRSAEMVAVALDAEQARWIRWHHERVDGRGYPDGLSGEEIPEGAAIIAVADAWDVITTGRPYRPPRSRRARLLPKRTTRAPLTKRPTRSPRRAPPRLRRRSSGPSR